MAQASLNKLLKKKKNNAKMPHAYAVFAVLALQKLYLAWQEHSAAVS